MPTLPSPIESKAFAMQAMMVSGLRMSSADRQSFHRLESQTQRKRSVQPRRSLWPRRNVVGPEADGGMQESQLAERTDVGNNLGGRKIESASVRKDYVLFLRKCNYFNTHGVFGRTPTTFPISMRRARTKKSSNPGNRAFADRENPKRARQPRRWDCGG